ECPCRPVIAQHAVVSVAADVEVAVRPEDHARPGRKPAAAGGDESAEENARLPVIAQYLRRAAETADIQVPVGPKEQLVRPGQAASACGNERVPESSGRRIVAQDAVRGFAGDEQLNPGEDVRDAAARAVEELGPANPTWRGVDHLDRETLR